MGKDDILFKRLRLSVIILSALSLAVLFAAVFTESVPYSSRIILTAETPQKVSISGNSDITVDITVSDLGDALYPAASFSIVFDNTRLEFLGVSEGNVETGTPTARTLPQWSFNTRAANSTGKINIMYLDITSGEHSFSKKLLADEYNVVLRLSFRLKGTARISDVYRLTFEDAVFAASDSDKSLAMQTNTLQTVDGKIVIGE